MTISGETKDENGLTMGDDYVLHFTPDIAYLEAAITVCGQPVENGGEVEVVLGSVEANFDIKITFNQDFLSANQTDCISQIKLAKMFPADAPVPVLTYADCTEARLFNQIWSKLTDEKKHDHPHYYKCVIPGGQNGITNGKGAYLKEDVFFYINAIHAEF
jgi:hypothetical protein